MRNTICLFLLSVTVSAASHAAELPAQIDWSERRVVSIPIDGLITSVEVEAGQRVSVGEVLITVAPPTYRFRLKKAQAEMRAAGSAYRDALREKNDAEALYEQTVLSDVELQKAHIAYDTARSKREKAEADLGLAEWAIGWTTVKASRDLWVIQLDVVPGQMIAGDERSEPLLLTASAQHVSAVAEISLDVAASVRVGDEVTVRVGKETHRASVGSLSAGGGKAYTLRADFAADIGAMKPGTRATIILP